VNYTTQQMAVLFVARGAGAAKTVAPLAVGIKQRPIKQRIGSCADKFRRRWHNVGFTFILCGGTPGPIGCLQTGRRWG